MGLGQEGSVELALPMQPSAGLAVLPALGELT